MFDAALNCRFYMIRINQWPVCMRTCIQWLERSRTPPFLTLHPELINSCNLTKMLKDERLPFPRCNTGQWTLSRFAGGTYRLPLPLPRSSHHSPFGRWYRCLNGFGWKVEKALRSNSQTEVLVQNTLFPELFSADFQHHFSLGHHVDRSNVPDSNLI